MRELIETQYQFHKPFVADTSKIGNKLDAHSTYLEKALAVTLQYDRHA